MFVPILPLFNEKYFEKQKFSIQASDYLYTSKYEYVPYNICDGDVNTAWASKTFKKSHVKFQFPNEYIPRKITITSSADASKSPKSFRLYGIPHETLDVMNTLSLKSADEEPAWIGCTLLLDVKNEKWKEIETKEWAFENNKKCKALVLYMYEKQGDWNGNSEYSISEFQCYEFFENEFSLIKRSSDGNHVAVTKRVKSPFVGFHVNDLSDKRSRFNLISSRNSIDINSMCSIYLRYGNFVLFGDEYREGKLYIEFFKYGNIDFGIGLVSKHTDNYLDYGINNVMLNFSGSWLYAIGAQRIGEKTAMSNMVGGDKRRIGIAFDLDNNMVEVIVDGKSMGKLHVRNLPKPLMLIFGSSTNSTATIELLEDAKFMPNGFKNIVSKKEYEYIISELPSNVSTSDYYKYGMHKGQKMEFDKPYDKEFVWSKKEEALAEGKVFSYQFSAKENIQKIKQDEVI